MAIAAVDLVGDIEDDGDGACDGAAAKEAVAVVEGRMLEPSRSRGSGMRSSCGKAAVREMILGNKAKCCCTKPCSFSS